MHPFVLSCCSTTDLTPEQYSALDLQYTSLHFFLEGKEYIDDYTDVEGYTYNPNHFYYIPGSA